MGSAVPRIRGVEYARGVFRQIKRVSEESIARDGEIDVHQVCDLLDDALNHPGSRPHALLILSHIIAASLCGITLDVPE